MVLRAQQVQPDRWDLKERPVRMEQMVQRETSVISVRQDPKVVSVPQDPKVISVPQDPKVISVPQDPKVIPVPQDPKVIPVLLVQLGLQATQWELKLVMG
jgi:hypothetical protein